MTEKLLSVGIDLGTTTTQMVVSELGIENTASPFSVPELAIRERTVLYESPVHFTPLLTPDTLDAAAIGELIRGEYIRAGITPEQVKTGAVIITGETARKENARQVLRELSALAGEFVVQTAGPALESVLAARGAGADRYAREHRRAVLHLDIGGGTSNLALFDREGELRDTGCLNVGGRLLKLDRDGTVRYRSPVLAGQPGPAVGQRASPDRLTPLLDVLVAALEEACGLRPRTALLEHFLTDHAVELSGEQPVLSFSGGVADCIFHPSEDWLRYGDLGVLLGRAIRASALFRGETVMGRETLRATVIGAGSYSTRLSGSTVYHHSLSFPLHDLPVERVSAQEELDPAALKRKLALHEGLSALAMEGASAETYGGLTRLADAVAGAAGAENSPLIVILRRDRAKALGQALRARLNRERPLLCLDGLSLPAGSYLDIGDPVSGAAFPVVIKTLVF